MIDKSDIELLSEYAQFGTEVAFAELVRRHVGFVYATAVRLVVDPHLAEDVTQAVFVALARNARKLRGRKVLSSWLHFTARNLAANVVRTEVRRRAREQEAAMMPIPSPEPESVWEHIAPHLDAALAELNAADRDALMLRFFERKTAQEIGERLGLGEEAAQKRVERALKRLRSRITARGVAVPVVALAGALSLPATHAAPMGLAAALTAKVLAEAATSIPLTSYLVKGFSMAHLKSSPITAAIAILACLSLGTAGFVAGKTAATKHHAAAAWQQAMLSPQRELSAASDPAPSTNTVSATPPFAAPQRLSVSEILAEAAQHFRALDTDPDAWSKGLVVLEKLRAEEAAEALRHFEVYRLERGVYEAMAPAILGLWAQTDPRAALQYALTNLQRNALTMSIERVSRAWARQEPDAAWAWYRETRDSAQPKIMGSVPKTVFAEWAGHDTPAAFERVARVSLADEQAALYGISEAARNPGQRPGILAAIAQMPDEEQRRRLARAVARDWAEIEPQAATEWAASLAFQNPAAGRLISINVFGEWWRLDPHAAAKWLLTQGPAALRDQIKNRMPPEELKKLQEAAR